ncbi:MAG: hypothetical protein GSR86_06390 [Desulfurococcales archaeon]|nr:hypothetical protein [Desulfurococcales archaeon]
MQDCMVFVFDIDGVLLDREGESIRSIGVEALRWAVEHGAVYIISGRSSRDKGFILDLLKSVEVRVGGIEDVLMRVPGDRRGEVDVKREYLLEVLSREGCILEVHDDNPRVLDASRRIVKGGLVLHYDNTCEAIYGRSIIPACSGGGGS